MQTLRRSTKVFGLKALKLLKKKRLTPAMKLKRLEFGNNHIDWTREHWSWVLLANESNTKQFGSRNHLIWKSVGFDEKYTQQTMKHSTKIITLGAICQLKEQQNYGLFFLPLHAGTLEQP